MEKSVKKILLILHIPPPVHGAAMVGKTILESDAINKYFDCEYINLSTSEKLNEIEKISLKKIFKYIGLQYTAVKKLASGRYDLCYITLSTKRPAFYKDLIISSFAKIFCKNVVFHLHNKGVKNYSKGKIAKILYRTAFKNAYVILLSRLLFDDIAEFADHNKVFYCPNGIKENEKLYKKSKNTVPVLLFLSNMTESKGVYSLLKACRILKEKGIQFQCLFAGSWYDVNENIFNETVKKYDLEQNIKYLGPRYEEEKEKVFSGSDIFIFPTFYEYETFGLVNLEAMSHSLPVISSFEGAIPEIIENGKTGFLVNPKDENELACKIEELIKNESLRIKMGNEGRIKFLKNYTNSVFEKNLINIFENIINSQVKVI